MVTAKKQNDLNLRTDSWMGGFFRFVIMTLHVHSPILQLDGCADWCLCFLSLEGPAKTCSYYTWSTNRNSQDYFAGKYGTEEDSLLKRED